MAKELFGSVSGRVRWACNGLLLIGLLWTAISVVIYFATEKIETQQLFAVVYFLYIGVTAIVALTLILLKQPAGRVVAWFMLPLVLLFMPIGTIAGIFVALGLHSNDMRQHLDLNR